MSSKIAQTTENFQLFVQGIENLVLTGERIEGTYLEADYPVIHFYDSKTSHNAMFRPDTREFISAWKLNFNLT